MQIGVVKEIKNNENRVGLVPAGVHSLVENGHVVHVEKGAGVGSGFSDENYKSAGAKIVSSAAKIYKTSEIIIKVKEPLDEEYEYLQEGQTLYAYLHLAASKPVTEILLKKKTTGVAYETVTDQNGKLPLLTPMSEVAGRLSIQIGANILLKHNNGSGVLLGGVPGVAPGTVLIIGGGVVGTNAAKMAVGVGARVIIMDTNVTRLRELDDIFGARVHTVAYSAYAVAELVTICDLLVSGVLIPGKKAPRVVTEEMVKTMKPGSVIVDVAIDQGGSIETIDRITSHGDPTYEKHGVIHYSVPNIPGSVPQTSTRALTNATLPFLLEMANKGVVEAFKQNPHLKEGVNTYQGHVTYKGVADSLDLAYTDLDSLIKPRKR